MLPKKYRLPGHRIPDLIKSGKRIHGSYAVLIIEDSPENTVQSKITCIVPIRLSKKAVERNRTKRLLRVAVYKYLDQIKPGFEVIVIAKKLLLNEKSKDVLGDIKSLLKTSFLIDSR